MYIAIFLTTELSLRERKIKDKKLKVFGEQKYHSLIFRVLLNSALGALVKELKREIKKKLWIENTKI
jgi:hypothetical protein